jgi:hypothetical protein
VNPVRVQSLNLFASCSSDEELHEKMDEVIQILLKLRSSELEAYTGNFIATAGLIVAMADEEMTEKELEYILSNLSSYQMFPRDFLASISQSNVEEIFGQSVNNILAANPGMREVLFDYMMGLVLSDRKIKDTEIEFLFMMGENVFGYTRKECADKLNGNACPRMFFIRIPCRALPAQ